MVTQNVAHKNPSVKILLGVYRRTNTAISKSRAPSSAPCSVPRSTVSLQRRDKYSLLLRQGGRQTLHHSDSRVGRYSELG